MSAVITRWGNSQGIRIPKVILDDLNWKENDCVNIKVQDGKVIIEKNIISYDIHLADLFKNYDGQSTPVTDYDWGDVRGKELL